MLKLIIPGDEYFDEEKQEFLFFEETTLFLEHSLIAISKWEQIYKNRF